MPKTKKTTEVAELTDGNGNMLYTDQVVAVDQNELKLDEPVQEGPSFPPHYTFSVPVDLPPEWSSPPKIFEIPDASYFQFRNAGLVNGVEYHLDQYGFINWRKHIKDEHIVLNREVYAREGIDVKALSAEEVARLKSEATEDKLLIKLDGFKDVARLRGIKSARPKVKWDPISGTAICHYTITWIGNRETDHQEQSHTSVASASTASVGPKWQNYIETIASNRAFSRAVRESLCIHVVGAEEIDDVDKEVEIISSGNPKKFLEELCIKKKIDFSTVKTYMEGAGMEVSDKWEKITDIPEKLVFSISDLIKNDKNSKE